MKVKQILIKDYKEFADEVPKVFDTAGLLVAKEIEAVIELEGGVVFSLGFSIMRDNPLFQLEAPRDIVREFLKNNFLKTSNNEAAPE
jgi:hypothetical protein